jgi:hypothetical protein
MQRREFLFYSLSTCQSAAALAQSVSDNPFDSASGAAAAIGKKQVSSVELRRPSPSPTGDRRTGALER